MRNTFAISRTVNSVTIYTRVASCIAAGDVKQTFSETGNTSAHGTSEVANILARNIGAISQIITITFTTATDFSAVSNQGGVSLTGGNRLSTWQPPNSLGGYYLAVPSTFWPNDGSGDWQAGDSVQIHSEPPAIPVFCVIDVPASSVAVELDNFSIWAYGSSGSA